MNIFPMSTAGVLIYNIPEIQEFEVIDNLCYILSPDLEGAKIVTTNSFFHPFIH